jgi:uncharacterized membrane protein YphA (DoxX/SURF4 family)
MKRSVPVVARLLVGGLFVVAGIFKIVQPAEFATDIGNYRLLPHALLNLMAITLPWVELVAGGLLLAGRWRRASALVVSVLMLVFVVAVAQAMMRGLDFRCGCFGTVGATQVGWTKLAENLALLAVTGWLCWRTED